MKDAEDEAFDELAKRQGHWGGGFMAKKAMAMDKMLEKATRSCNHIDEQRALDALMREALAQPAQEPVAWAIYDKRGGSKSLHWPENHSPDGDATKFDAVPLYTTPPQREWVGLTEGEREEIVSGYTIGPGFELEAVGDVESVARAVEDKLKEKNNG